MRLMRLWLGWLSLPLLGVLGADPDGARFRLHPLAQAPSVVVAPDANAPDVPTGTAADPRVARLARWLRQAVGRSATPSLHSIAVPSVAERQAALERLRQSRGRGIEVFFREVNGTPLQMGGGVLEPRFTGFVAGNLDPDELTARAFLQANRILLRIENPDAEWVLVRRVVDELGRRHLRFAQAFSALPVWPCELSVHLDAAGNVDLMDGAFVPTPVGVATTALVTSDEARAKARAALAAGAEATVSEPELLIFALLDRPARLAWKIEVSMGPGELWRCVVDALEGDLLQAVSLIQHAAATGQGVDGLGQSRPLDLWQEGGTFFMVDTSKPMFDRSSAPPTNARGSIQIYDAANARVDDPAFTAGFVKSTSANASWLPDAVGAAFGLSETYDYYLDRHARDSLDGRGGNIRAVVRYGRNEQNAYWNPGTKTMLYGDGFTKALDVSGHELTHGVINSIGNGGILEYHDQPGALNEAFADIFGEMVEAWNRNGRPDWLKGQELGFPFVIQNYANPGAAEFAPGRKNPAKMSEFVPPTDPIARRDAGGVHINSSIINHGFYLLAEGLPGAVGLRDAERIFYRALTLHLQKQSQFIDARHACLAAAEALFGEDSNQWRQTAEAFDRVEIVDAPRTPAPTPLPPVPSSDATLALRFDPAGSQYFLVRLETARGDGADGEFINTLKYLAPRRVSITGNGATAFYVTSDNDLGIVETDGSNPRVADSPGLVHSLAAAPDGQRYAFVLLEDTGQPSNGITLVDLAAQTERVIHLYAPGSEGARLDIIQFADAMDFTTDGQTLIYDAYAEIRAEGGQVFGGWTLYALDLRSDTIRALIDLNDGFDFGNPSLGNTRNHLITYEVINRASGVSTVFAGDLVTGDVVSVATINPAQSIGIPGYTGDDQAIVYAQGDNSVTSGFSLVRQPMGADGITPNGQPAVWFRDADIGVIYRRGPFVAVNAPPTAQITSPTAGQQFNPGSTITIQSTAQDADGSVAKVEFYAGSTRLGEDLTAPYSFAWANVAAGTYRLIARATDNVGASADSSAVEIQVGVVPRHPADHNPPDNRITLQEMIAYAAAYKRGDPWPVGPNPIPLDYIIRAATLYKRGETYRHDPGAGGAPLWWVNTPP